MSDPFSLACSFRSLVAASPEISSLCASDGPHSPPCVGPCRARASRPFTGSFFRDRDNRTITRLCLSSGDMVKNNGTPWAVLAAWVSGLTSVRT
eukprot:1619479-Pyramimonas_sp.AAC.1